MTPQPDTADTPRPDRPVFAVGDLHGRSDLLDRALDRIAKELATLGHNDASIVFLGDYIDRGEDSRGVLEMLMEVDRTMPDVATCLMGNHEKMMIDFLDEPETRGSRFLSFGGLQTLASFGIGGLSDRARPEQMAKAAEALKDAMPDGMEAWLRALPLWWQSGDVVCVHAAMDPSIPPALQERREMLWGHPLFHRFARPDGLWVVHGHEVVDAPGVDDRRVATDTGAYFSNRLTTAAILPGAEIRFFTA